MPADQSRFRIVRLVAIVAGLLGFVLALLTPVLPVQQESASIDWPQQGTKDIAAPLVSYTPLQFSASIPCAAADELRGDGGTLLSTVPRESGRASDVGIEVRVAKDGPLELIVRNIPMLSVPPNECSTLTIDSDHARTSVDDGAGTRKEVAGDHRPQVVGFFTDLPSVPAGLSAHADIDSRFSSSPSLLKYAAMLLAIVATLVALVALHILDGSDGRKARRIVPAHWWRVSIPDVVVVGTLVGWHIVGANTSDDGYLLNMARVSDHAGYMANYFRWFGVPEAPFGWYYDVLAAFAKISTASPWMRLPALLAGIVCWLIISREVLPRLGNLVRRNTLALWTAGLVFLAFWLPYNNGLRPEPIIALGALVTWCSIERAVATGRLLPAAIAVLVAAFSLAAGPSGLICIAALIAGARPVLEIIVRRAGRAPAKIASLLAPGMAAGTLVLVAVFADQTLASVLESTRVRTSVGPNTKWFEEHYRWDSLMTISPDGSLARRFGVFVMLLSLVVGVVALLRRNGHIPGVSRGPATRVLGIVFGSLFLMWFTPTKWTHHFGVYAGLAASVAALAAVAVGTANMRSARNRTLFAAAVMFITALAFTSSNGWWYVSSYGIPWWDKPPSIAGKGFATLMLGLTILLLLLALFFHFRAPYTHKQPRNGVVRAVLAAPLTIAAAFVVVFEVLSFAKGAVSQWPAYSIAKSNLASLAGNTCGLARDVLVETDANAAMLKPITGTVADGLSAENNGFTPNGVASDLTADAENTTAGAANSLRDDDNGKTSDTTSSGTAGGTEEGRGVNGSSVSLPFGLDPATTPVLGSYQNSGDQKQTSLVTQWYGLDRTPDGVDQRAPRDDIIAIAAAGRIRHFDNDGIEQYGQDLVLEYGVREGSDVRVLGSTIPLDIGPQPSWRNLRVPLSAIPPEADAVRLVATDNNITVDQWLAVTPPRVPKLETLDTVVGHDVPTLLDWSVGLAFPCQRPFDHHDGVAEVPEYRILPDRVGADSTNKWQDDIGGGPLGWIPLLLQADAVPTYSADDWGRDWGSLERLTPYVPDEVPATLDVTETTRSGFWSPGPIREKK